jgi:hypothetical protein
MPSSSEQGRRSLADTESTLQFLPVRFRSRSCSCLKTQLSKTRSRQYRATITAQPVSWLTLPPSARTATTLRFHPIQSLQSFNIHSALAASFAQQQQTNVKNCLAGAFTPTMFPYVNFIRQAGIESPIHSDNLGYRNVSYRMRWVRRAACRIDCS